MEAPQGGGACCVAEAKRASGVAAPPIAANSLSCCITGAVIPYSDKYGLPTLSYALSKPNCFRYRRKQRSPQVSLSSAPSAIAVAARGSSAKME